MKLLIIVALAAVAFGSYFHEDIGRMLSEAGVGRSQANVPVVNSMGNLGGAMNNNLQTIGRSFGQ